MKMQSDFSEIISIDGDIRPISSWQHPESHTLSAISDPWYKCLVQIQHVFFVSTVNFFTKYGLRSMQLPITTTAVSSPMARGSDSLPVKIVLDNKSTYLADSMQFMLEYGCRLHQNGTFYIMPSFRGEQPDKTHLNQFYHSEAELIGDLEMVMELVEEYISTLCRDFLTVTGELLLKTARQVGHITAIAKKKNPLPRCTIKEALDYFAKDPEFIRIDELSNVVSLTKKGELALVESYGGSVWLTEFDHMSVPFYQAFSSPQYKTAKAADLLLGGIGEVCCSPAG